MIAVVQRVSEASVAVVSPSHQASIGPGLCVLVGVEIGDSAAEASWIAAKLVNLRIFPDEQNRMNRSLHDVKGEMLLVSQFTLAGDCRQGNRPSFTAAAEPALGQTLFNLLCDEVRDRHGVPVKTGLFGAHMRVSLVNDGPVTIILQRKAPNSRNQGQAGD